MTQIMDTTPLTRDQGQLLDVIDSLRLQGIDRHVPLPQLIVCGDQSSGKSSVLEAVSGVRFPVKDTLCTRFATELILRRASKANVTISIRPSQERSDEAKKRLINFTAPTNSIDEFPHLIEAAKDAMGLNFESRKFSEDILRIELSGPEQPHLTLVDLPGVFHSSSKEQSAEESKLVKTLVRSYMASKNSIILAVVSAKNDVNNQVVTDFTRKVDPRGLRTLGIITKPDTLKVRSESETAFRDLAKNENVSFRLGWHVLRNRDFDTKDHSAEERDQMETEFFSGGIWTSLPASILGIGTLKSRLSRVLRDQIISVLPSLIQDIDSGIKDCQSRLHLLGEARQTVQEQRGHLIRVGQKFSTLIRAAVDGAYSPDFFGDATTSEGYHKRLRTVLQNQLLIFAEDMRDNGKETRIIDDDHNQPVVVEHGQITRSKFVDDTVNLMRWSRGRELPGTFNPLIVGDLFYQQAKPWKSIVQKHSEKIMNAARTSLEVVARASADANTCEGLLHELIYPALNQHSEAFQRKVAEILQPHQRGHPITYNHYLIETIQKVRQERAKKRLTQQLSSYFDSEECGNVNKKSFAISTLVAALTRSTEADMDRRACSEAIDCMEAYYKVCNTFYRTMDNH